MKTRILEKKNLEDSLRRQKCERPRGFRDALRPGLEERLGNGCDPTGGPQVGRRSARGAALPYWELINSVFGLDITVVNPRTDPTFSFMMVDHEGWIRMGLFDVGRSQVKQTWLLRSHTHIFLLSRISVCSRTVTTASC